MQKLISTVFGLLLTATLNSNTVRAEPFQDKVVPFVKQLCIDCHNGETSEGELNLTQYKSVAAMGQNFRQWEHVIGFMRKGEMPPKDSEQPTKQLRAEIIALLEKLMHQEARKRAGDPGVVLPRRLSNAEYNYTVRDLTGHDIRPADSFPVDPASGEGFNNTGEALTMSPALFKKYYAAAQFVADHAIMKPSGFEFAAYPVVTYADRKKFYEQAILDFYKQHDVNYAVYLTELWHFYNKNEDSISLEQWAKAARLSPRYMSRLDATLKATSDSFYLGRIARKWKTMVEGKPSRAEFRSIAAVIQQYSRLLCPRETPAIVANAGNPPIYHIDRRSKTAAERSQYKPDLVTNSQQISVAFRDLNKRDKLRLFIHVSNPFDDKHVTLVLSDLNLSPQQPNRYRANDKNRNIPFREVLQNRAPKQLQKLTFGMLPDGQNVGENDLVISVPSAKSIIELELPATFGDEKHIYLHAKATLHASTSEAGAAHIALSDQRLPDHDFITLESSLWSPPLIDTNHDLAKSFTESCRTYCATFPNRFLYVDGTRGLSAGFHLIEGFFRDDQPLCDMVLDEKQNIELDRLWTELRFGTGIAEKMLRGFVFFERSERNFMKDPVFDDIKEEDPKLVEEETLTRFRDIYLKKSRINDTGEKLAKHPIYTFFESLRSGLKEYDAYFEAARPIYRDQLVKLAFRAFRRELTPDETDKLTRFYDSVCDHPEFSVEQAVRASIIRLLVSPNFCYRLDVPPQVDYIGPIREFALASRLSYFLWSSMPDDEISQSIYAGTFSQGNTLRQQTHRMVRDDRVSAFALEFFGQWLGHRDFLTQESVNREVFKSFDDELKQAMFEEPTRLITHLIQNDLPITKLLNGDDTMVNERLAKHYGIKFDKNGPEWQMVSNTRDHGRSGVLGMAVFLTKNSQPERTSPVKRGFWVFHKLLGQHIPAPPPDVVALPAKETETGGKTIRELLKLHTEDEKCARCHVRFDPIGLSMEGFDPIGKLRKKDLAGRPIDDIVHLENDQQARGVAEFADYLESKRRDEFVKTLCRKLLGYALSRSLLLSDQPLLEKMETTLHENGYKLGEVLRSWY